MKLPIPQNKVPHTRSSNYFYQCISDTHLVLPFVDDGFKDQHMDSEYHLVMYDVSRTYHTALVYTRSLGKIKNFKSIDMDVFNNVTYLYVYTDETLLVLKAFEHYNLFVPDSNLEYFEERDEIKFEVILQNANQNNEFSSRNVRVSVMRTGIDLEKYYDKVTIRTTSDDHYYHLNIDDYFEGFRESITVYSNSEDPPIEINDPSLFNLTYTILSNNTYEIANSHFNYESQKSLTLVDEDNTIYLYIDCLNFLYLKLDDLVAKIQSRYEHFVEGRITSTKFDPNFFASKELTDVSLGTMFILYQMNEEDEIIKMCDVDPGKPPDCTIVVNYPLGKIINYFVYRSSKSVSSHFVVGSVSKTSHFSLIRFFKEVPGKNEKTEFTYNSELSATSLDTLKFCLDSLTRFDHFLVFTNHNSMYIIDLDEYLDRPQYFTPKQLRELHLDILINRYSNEQYTKTENITAIHIQETCQEHLSVYIFTKYNGILMLEVNKASFYSERWKNDDMLSSHSSSSTLLKTTESKNINELYVNTHIEDIYSIIADGRLLHNYYSFDYENCLYAVNNRMMGLLVKLEFEGGYHIYVFR